MATMKDIARLAGVSHGTVSNVLNGRGNVKLEKIRLVEAAAEQLGYSINTQAKNLRKSVADVIAVILPEIESPQYRALYNAMENVCAGTDHSLQLCLTNYAPARELDYLKRLDAERISGVAVVTCLRGEQLAVYRRLERRGMDILFVEHRPDAPGFSYAGFDFAAAGRDVAAYVRSLAPGRVGLFTLTYAYSSEKEFGTALCSSLGDVTHIKTDHKLAFNHGFLFFEDGDAPDVIVATSLSLARQLRKAYEFAPKDKPLTIVCLACDDLVQSDAVVRYRQNYGKLGNIVCHRLIDRQPEPELLVDNTGFRKPYVCTASLAAGDTLNVLTLDSPSSYALMKLAPAFTRQTGVRVNFAVFSHDELYNTLSDPAVLSLYDVVRLDVAWLPWYARQMLQPLDFRRMGLNGIEQRLLPNVLDNYSVVGGERYALPFDLSIQLLFYRKDLYEDPLLRRMYYEQTRSELRVPDSFAEFNRSSAFFTRSLNTHSPVGYGTALPLGNSSMITCEFLPRLADFHGSVFGPDNRCTLDSDAALAALENYRETFHYAYPLQQNAWWSESVGHFAAGDAAGIVVFMNHASSLVNTRASRIVGNIGVAGVPGGQPVLGGGVLGISRYARHADESVEFLRWVASEEISTAFSFLGGIAPYEDVFANSRLLELYPWLLIAKRGIVAGSTRRLLRRDSTAIEERKIEHILGMAIKNHLLGITTAEEALATAKTQIDDFVGARLAGV